MLPEWMDANAADPNTEPRELKLMPRKARSYKRHPVDPDNKYNSVKIAKFINYVMTRGKKTVASRVVYDALGKIETEMKADPKNVFEQAIRNVSPMVEVKGRRIGGA